MKIFILLTCFFGSGLTLAQQLDSVTYTFENKEFTGFYAKPLQVTPKTKTILIVHEWWGLNDYPKQRALELAKSGFIAFCIDMYGTGQKAEDPQGAMKLAAPFYENPEMAYNHFMAGYNAAINVNGVNQERMCAIGYCFGGSMVLNAAKMGAPVDAVVSFHGGLAGIPVVKTKLSAAVLVCHGADDKFVPQKDIDTLANQMKKAGADYTFIAYPNATHAFTNKNSTSTGQKYNIPIAYNEAADKKSWADFLKFVKKKVN